MMSVTGIKLYVNPTVARAAREMGVLLADYHYSPRAVAEIVAYAIREGTPTGAPGLDREDEADAAMVFEESFPAVGFDSPAWGEFAAVVDCPACGGYGGEPGSNFGDHGWHPCFRCGATGKVEDDDDAKGDRADDRDDSYGGASLLPPIAGGSPEYTDADYEDWLDGVDADYPPDDQSGPKSWDRQTQQWLDAREAGEDWAV